MDLLDVQQPWKPLDTSLQLSNNVSTRPPLYINTMQPDFTLVKVGTTLYWADISQRLHAAAVTKVGCKYLTMGNVKFDKVTGKAIGITGQIVTDTEAHKAAVALEKAYTKLAKAVWHKRDEKLTLWDVQEAARRLMINLEEY